MKSDLFKIFIKIIIVIVTLVGIFFLGRYTKPYKEKIRIITETKTKYVIKKIPITQKDFENCYNSKIDIEGQMQDNWIHVTASDDCKKSNKSFKLTQRKRNLSGVAGVQVGAGLNHSLQPSFYIGVGFTYGLVLF